MEAGKELIGLLKDVPQVLTSIYQDLAQPGVKKVGIAWKLIEISWNPKTKNPNRIIIS